jgi:DNA topoisomerase I
MNRQSKNHVDRQKATATYFIDKLALRVGGEKDTEEEADTVKYECVKID